MPMFKNDSYLWLVLARTLTGIGFGNSALIRAYASQSSSSEDRSRALAWTTAGDTLGTTTGLLVQILFFPLGLEGFSFFGFPFTAYTTRALLACLINVFGFIIVSKFFVEDYTMLRIEKKELDNQTVSPCWLALGICVLTRSSQALLLSTNDVVGSPYISMMFGYSEKETLQYNILMMLIQSVIGLVIYFAYITLNLGKKLAIRTSIRLSLASFLLYHVLTFSYPFYSDYVELENPAAMSREYGVCEVRRYSWCTTLTTFNPFLYYISYLVLIGGFFPIINIALTTLLSKVIGPRAQGTYQGLFQVAGCISKMSSPVMLGYAYDMAGPRLLWIIQESQTIFVFLLWIAFNGRMIGMSERIEKMERRQKVTRKEMSQKAVNVWTTNNHKTRNEFVNIK
ncbi:unnamed protein product, partial [Mesorhabditis belari]|uniref:Uncharacterized protein n=1 Tax=Mesorhabditis belari TaxID=2138241 RepID=A0AAF3FQF6_9BILA